MGRGQYLNVFRVVNASLLIHLKQVGLVNHKVNLCPLIQHPILNCQVSNHSFLSADMFLWIYAVPAFLCESIPPSRETVEKRGKAGAGFQALLGC